VYKIHTHTHILHLFSIHIYKPPSAILTPKARFKSRDVNHPWNSCGVAQLDLRSAAVTDKCKLQVRWEKGPMPPHCWRFEISLRHTTFGKTPLDECIRPRGQWVRQLGPLYTKHVRNDVYTERSFRKAVIHAPCFSPIRILFYDVYFVAVRRTTAYSFTMTGNVIPAQALLMDALAKSKEKCGIIFSVFMFARRVSW